MSEVEEEKGEKPRRIDYIARYSAILVAFIVFGGTIYQANKDGESTSVEFISELHRRIEVLENRLEDVNRELFDSKLQVMECTLRESSTNSAKELLTGVIDWIPYPVWVKQVSQAGGEIKITMVVVNKAYEKAYDVTRESYYGKTDIERWGVEDGTKFLENDLEVFEEKKTTSFTEVFSDSPGSGTNVKAKVTKGVFEVGGIWYIAGSVSSCDPSKE